MAEHTIKKDKPQRQYRIISIPETWIVKNNSLVITSQQEEYYLLLFLQMSLSYDTIEVQWLEKYRDKANRVISTFLHCGWIETKRRIEEKVLKDNNNPGESYMILANIAIMEKAG